MMLFDFQSFGVGASGNLPYLLNSMLGAMNPMFSVADKRTVTVRTLGEMQRILQLLQYPHFLDEVVTPDAWEVLGAEYKRITGSEVRTLDTAVRETIRLDDIHARIAARAAEMQAEMAQPDGV